MAKSKGIVMFALFVVFNVTLVRSVFNQTNETDVGAVKSLDVIREYERTAKWKEMYDIHETVDEQQAIKEIEDLLGATDNGRLRMELRKKPSEHEELFQKKCNMKIQTATIIAFVTACTFVALLLLHFNIPKKLIKYVKKLKNTKRYCLRTRKIEYVFRIPEQSTKLQLQ
ncbi:hypothetical protein T10_2116 [Trichinella papuae]|uniref:Transmembrane protein n=1 Tax=Trichinella papuae TaxID=268474 RepID=A0A0V1MKD7_9BILA|nr:hypothetical protein T10_2116 [Trichinella papuae]